MNFARGQKSKLSDLTSSEGLIVGVGEELGEALLVFGVVTLEPSAQGLYGPVDHRVCRVIEHLADDLAPYAGVGAALDLHDGRDRVLVEEKVVH